MNFCSDCGAAVTKRIPAHDDRPRFVCDSCGAIHYQNPQMVVGALPESGGRILLCRRAIDPARDKWTLPAGYLENSETLEEGAARETLEESGYLISNLKPYAVASIPRINQVYFIFRCCLSEQAAAPGSESSEVRLFDPDAVPWPDIAFRSIHEVLRCYCLDLRDGAFTFRLLTID